MSVFAHHKMWRMQPNQLAGDKWKPQTLNNSSQNSCRKYFRQHKVMSCYQHLLKTHCKGSQQLIKDGCALRVCISHSDNSPAHCTHRLSYPMACASAVTRQLSRQPQLSCTRLCNSSNGRLHSFVRPTSSTMQTFSFGVSTHTLTLGWGGEIPAKDDDTE